MRRGGSLCWSPHSSARSSRAQRGVRRVGRRVLERATRDQARYPGLSRISMHCVNGRRLDCHAAATAAAPSCARARTGAGGRRRQHGSAAAPTKSTSAKHERQARAPSTSAKHERQARAPSTSAQHDVAARRAPGQAQVPSRVATECSTSDSYCSISSPGAPHSRAELGRAYERWLAPTRRSENAARRGSATCPVDRAASIRRQYLVPSFEASAASRRCLKSEAAAH